MKRYYLSIVLSLVAAGLYIWSLFLPAKGLPKEGCGWLTTPDPLPSHCELPSYGYEYALYLINSSPYIEYVMILSVFPIGGALVLFLLTDALLLLYPFLHFYPVKRAAGWYVGFVGIRALGLLMWAWPGLDEPSHFIWVCAAFVWFFAVLLRWAAGISFHIRRRIPGETPVIPTPP